MPMTRENSIDEPQATVKKDSTFTLAQRAYDVLKQEILSGRIEEGQFLDVDTILSRYGIGRTPFREACQRLSQEKLLDVVPRRGLIIPELSIREIRNLLEARVMIEPAIAALAAVRRTDEELLELEKIDQSFKAIPMSETNYSKIVAANCEFHRTIGTMAHNRELATVGNSLLERMIRVSTLQLRTIQNDEFRELHAEIIDAIRSQDAEAARSAVKRDILHGQFDLFGPNSITAAIP